MPVSNSELRILLNMQARGQEVAQQAAQQVRAIRAAIDDVGKGKGFEEATRHLRVFGRLVEDVSKAQPYEKMILSAKQAVAEQERLAGSAQRVVQGYRQIGQAAQQAARQVQAASAAGRGGGGPQQQAQGPNVAGAGAAAQALANVRAAFAAAQQQAASASHAITQSLLAIGNAARGVAGGVAGGLSGAVNGLRTLTGGITGVAGTIANLSRSTAGLRAASADVNTFSASLRSMIGVGASIVGIQSVLSVLQQAFSAVGDAAIGFNSTLENTRTAFTSLLGSQEKAVAFLAQLRDVAERTSFEFPDLLKAAQQLVGVGLAAENVIPLMKDVAGAMAAAGRTTADINGVSRALQQIFTTGRVQADEMNQLAERGVPGWRILGQAIQQSGESIESAIGRARKLGEQGKISAADFFNAFQEYSRTAGWREMAENAVATFTGAVSNLKDSFRFLISDATEPAFQALSSGLQNFSKLLMSTPVRQFALDVGATVKEVIASFSGIEQAFANIAEGFRTDGISGALQAIVGQFAGLGGDMNSAGAQLMAEYASGIMQGASDAIQGAVDFVADLIASFLIGSSPPPAGPLANIDQGGRNVGIAWVQGLSEGFDGVEEVVVGVADAFRNVDEAMSLGNLEAAFERAKGNAAQLMQVAEAAEGGLRSLNALQRDINEEQGNLQNQADLIKEGYGAQAEGLERTIASIQQQNTYAERYADLIQQQNDAIASQADLRDRAALNELKAAEIAAEGDPVRRAQLVAEQQVLKFQEDELQLAQRARDLDRRAEEQAKKRAEAQKDGKDFNEKDFQIEQQRLALDRRQLENARQLAGITDKGALANIAAQRAQIEAAAATRRVEEDRARIQTDAVKNAAAIERAQRAILALPYEEQLAAIKAEQEAQLAPLEARLGVLQREERQLNVIRQAWQGIKQDIAEATKDQKATDKGTNKPTGPGFAGGGLNLDRVEIDVQAATQRVGHSMAAGIASSLQENLPRLLLGALGAILGASVFGPLGLVAGAAFGAQVGAGLQARIPDLNTIIGDIGRTFMQAFAGDWEPDAALAPAINAAGMLGMAFRTTADVIAATWEAMKGPVQAGAQWVRENSGLAAAALTGLLVPAFGLLLSTVGAVISPIIALLAPLTPAILAVSAAAVALKLAWDANFGGIRDTVAAALPFIQTAITQLGAAFQALTRGDFGEVANQLSAAFSNLGSGLGPILDGIGQAIWDQTKEWAAALWQWVVDATPRAVSALGDWIAEITAGVRDGSGPLLRSFLAWGRSMIDWIGPMIPEALAALNDFGFAIVEWSLSNAPAVAEGFAYWATLFTVWIVRDVIPQIPGLLAALGVAMVENILRLGSVLLPALVQIGLAIARGIWTGLQEAMPEFTAALEGLWAGIVEGWASLVETVSSIAAAIGDAWNALIPLLQSVWDAILAAPQAAMDGILGLWEAGWAAVQAAWDAAGSLIEAAVLAVWNSLSQETRDSLTAMVAAISSLWERIVQLATTIWNAILAVVTTVLTTLTQMATTWIASELQAWQQFTTALGDLWNALVAIATAAWTAVTDEITRIVTAWWEIAKAFWDEVQKAITAVWETLSKTLGPIVQRTMDEITRVFDGWWATAQSYVEKWTDLGTRMATGLMDAIRDGVNKKIQEVAGAIQGAAEKLTGIIDSILGRGGGGGGGGTQTLSFNPGGAGGNIDPQRVAQAQFTIDPSKGKEDVLRQWAPVLRAIEQSGGPLARNIAAIILAENGGGNSDLVRNSKNWFSISATAERRAKGLQAGTDRGGRFASYSSDSQALADFLDLIMNNPRYKDAWASRTGSTESMIQGLVKGGYIVPEPGFPVADWVRNTSQGAKTFDEVAGNIPALTSAVRTGVQQGVMAVNSAGRVPVVQNATGNSYWTSGGTHGGAPAADIFAPKGSPIFAPVGGTSRPAEYEKGGLATIIEGDDGKLYYMAHGNVPFKGGRVEAGQQIGEVGDTGNARGTSPHLHYAIATLAAGINANGSGNITGLREDWLEGTSRPTGPTMMAGGMGRLMSGGAGVPGFDPSQWPGFMEQVSEKLPDYLQSLETIQQAGTLAFDGTAQAAVTAGAQLVSASTDSLGNVTRIYSDATGVIGATITDAGGQVVNAWGAMAAAVTPGTEAVTQGAQVLTEQAAALATTLTAGMVPAGAAAGTAIQQMTDDINPLLAEVAAGTLTTDQLVMKLGALALNAGLTSEPLTGMADKTMTAQEAMLTMLNEAAKVDPQFAVLRDQLVGAGVDAQAMAVTFAEGVANSVGVATAAVGQMATGVDPLLTAVNEGTVSGAELERIIVQMADAAGLATAPFRQMSDGVIDSNQALEDVIALSADVGPEFKTLADEVATAGTVSEEAAKKYLELIRAFRQGLRPSEDAAEHAHGVGEEAQAAVVPITEMGTAMVEQATASAEAFQTTLVGGVQTAIEGVRGEVGNAEAAGSEVGSAIVRGMESGISTAAESVASKAAEVVRSAIEAARNAADAHSPSEETRKLGFHLDAGLELGQIEDAKYVEQAARGVIGGALAAMRDEADAHSPSGEGVRIGKDIMKGLVQGLRSESLGDVARDQIGEYIKVAGNFSDQFAKQVDIGVAQLQHEIAGQQRDTLESTLALKDAQEAVERASRGSWNAQRGIAEIGVKQAQIALQQANSAQADLNTQNLLRDVEAERERIASGSLQDRHQLARLGSEIAGYAVRQADLGLREAQATRDSLGVRRQLAEVEAERARAAQGSIADQMRQIELGQRGQRIVLDQAAAEREMLPLKAQARDLQRQIEAATKSTVAAQQAAIREEAAQAAQRIEQLRIQQQLEDAEDTGGGLSQEQINALHERDRTLQRQAETNARQAEIEKLQATIATASDRERLVALQDQIAHREEALLPLQDEKALLDNENQTIQANMALAAAGYDAQIIKLQAQVASHDAVALKLANERDVLDSQTAILQAQQEIITATNEARATALDGQIIQLAEAQAIVERRLQGEQDILDRLGNQQARIEAVAALEAARLQDNLIMAEYRQFAEQGTLRTLERQLEIQQATAGVISTQVSLANALKSALEAAGVINTQSSSSGSSKKKKKKKASGGPVYEDDIVLVGELGPEIFVPPADGYILNNARTEQLLSQLDVVTPRIDSTVRERQVGGTVWGGRSYLVGEGGGPEGYMGWEPGGGAPQYAAQPMKVVQSTVHYHVHEQQRSGEARVERVVYEALQVALNS